MEYVKFGNTGIKVSRFCLGVMDFPSRLEKNKSIEIILKALDKGINFIDTADAYGRGLCEEILGEALTPEKRKKVILTTKFWVKMEKNNLNSGGCSRYHIIRALEESLKRLKTDYIDLYLLHHPDPNTPAEETLSTLDSLVKQGKVRYLGVSNHYAWQMAHMLGVSALHNWEPIVAIQCRYNIIDRVIENETIPFCKRFNIAMMTYGPLAGGILTGRYKRGESIPEDSRVAGVSFRKMLTNEVFDLLDEMGKISERYNIPLNRLSVVWLLSKSYVTSVILGGSKPEHYESIYPALEDHIDEEDLQKIDELSEKFCYQPFSNQPIKEGAPKAQNWF
ncbi:aldo/keto reductase [Candidatus Desantisbacteria bacterium CG07_land_8_20_14_0_80_39_15]|uniref:Aldo/keto reductase n=1 Tax=Candidatus Desantisbacteria bacterium CG07_land_8_20_14_0_80_39_15 TaxID=1974549 RepID=A0A2M6ZGS7_9BACT|nr:MAG: aldo/keto reductase [Candidatus Desantisbacteria bacterium CG07_land_8_20_14_0_80_39_15]